MQSRYDKNTVNIILSIFIKFVIDYTHNMEI